MKHLTLGQDLEVSRLGLGCMGMSAFYTGSGSDDDAAVRTLHRALELGITFFDTAEIYGPYTNEELLGRAFADRRDQVVIATKFGVIRHTASGERGLDGSPANVRLAVEGSLRRLRTDYIDLYYQHRMDPAVPVEETMGALADLVAQGKIRHIGLSEAAPATLRRAHAVHPVTALQTEYSLWTRDPEQEVLPLVRELGIGFVPYSPLGRGFLTGTIRSLDQLDEADVRRYNPRFAGDNLEANIRIVEQVDAVAKKLGATPGQVVLAWLLAQGGDLAPIPGTRRIEHLEENIAAEALELSGDHLAALSAVAAPVGDRYADMSTVNR
ncbi:aldo/keto reductase [Arthrobacter zhaoguopingii]|uniref:aldo/keto reductase n=1 Tax=Arthrobacter zhaoguopingii TaxID=2681491 RepID=UPI001358E611|nr:aldo/keto reductase [Arthrobacter zhaoguopingii]